MNDPIYAGYKHYCGDCRHMKVRLPLVPDKTKRFNREITDLRIIYKNVIAFCELELNMGTTKHGKEECFVSKNVLNGKKLRHLKSWEHRDCPGFESMDDD